MLLSYRAYCHLKTNTYLHNVENEPPKSHNYNLPSIFCPFWQWMAPYL